VKIATIALPVVRLALAEDLGSGDVTTNALVSETARARAHIEARTGGVIAGLEVAGLAFHELDRDVVFRMKMKDGTRVKTGQVICTVEGRSRAILSAERVALNLFQHLSGIATLTARYVELLKDTAVRVRDTRKTLPGMRVLEKYAVLVGGGQNHRFGLFDMVLIKDNHLPAVGSITAAVREVRRRELQVPIQVEVRNPEEAEEAARAGVDQLLLDNMDAAMIQATLDRLEIKPGGAVDEKSGKRRWPWIEVSGGIHLDNVRELALPGVDSVSIGALTHSAPALDLALTVETIEDFA
jgi:nicotinate-nucleotide pyrophosphorylase (carboxylating)